MNRLNELLNKKITIKIISVLMAVLLWMYIINDQNPYRNRSLTVKLNTINMDSLQGKGLVLKNENIRDTIDITIRGRAEVINNVRPGDFIAVLDFSQVESERDKEIGISMPEYELKDISLESYSPRTIEIDLERLKEKTFPVELSVDSKIKDNYKVISVTHIPESINISNVESVIDNIALVKAVVSINNLNSSLSIEKECKVYDKEGEEIPMLSRNINVDINVVIAKQVPIDLVLRGTPAKDYVRISTSIEPEQVLITGSYRDIEAINRLETEPVDITNISEDLNVSSLIDLPDGVKLVEAPKEVAVSINIEKLLRKDFTISKENISLDNSNANDMYTYEIASDTIKFAVKGLENDIKVVDAGSFRPYVNVDGLEPGSHSVALNLDLPNGIEIVQRPQVEVKVVKLEEPQQE